MAPPRMYVSCQNPVPPLSSRPPWSPPLLMIFGEFSVPQSVETSLILKGDGWVAETSPGESSRTPSPVPPGGAVLARLARYCYQRRRLVVLAWIGLLIVAIAGGSAFKGAWSTSGRLPGTDSQRAYDLLKTEFPGRAGEDGAFVFADAAADPQAVATFLASAATVDGVTSVEQPPEFSPDGRVAQSAFTLATGDDARTKAAVARLKDLAKPLRGHGDIAFASRWFDAQEMPSSEGLGLLAAIVVLLVAFGSVV